MAQSLQVATKPFTFSLDPHSGVPVYRQLIDQVQAGVAAGLLKPAQQLPTVRQVAVDLTINPNTVQRAYREMEIRGILETQQGTGTFISNQENRTLPRRTRAQTRAVHQRFRRSRRSRRLHRAGAHRLAARLIT